MTNKHQRGHNFKIMKNICTMPTDTLMQYMDIEPTPTVSGMNYWYKDNGGDILAVAHLDSVVDYDLHFKVKGAVVHTPTLDDRLGVYVITYLLKDLKVDWLFTDGEEMGRSTAKFFETDKQYNWIFEFDRMGDDVVMYQYETKEMNALLEDVGFDVGWGSFSDISELDHLGVAGFNIGTAYHDYHSRKAFASLKQLNKQVSKFRKFYNTHKETRLDWDGVDRSFTYYPSDNSYFNQHSSTYDDYYYSYQERFPSTPINTGSDLDPETERLLRKYKAYDVTKELKINKFERKDGNRTIERHVSCNTCGYIGYFIFNGKICKKQDVLEYNTIISFGLCTYCHEQDKKIRKASEEKLKTNSKEFLCSVCKMWTSVIMESPYTLHDETICIFCEENLTREGKKTWLMMRPELEDNDLPNPDDAECHACAGTGYCSECDGTKACMFCDGTHQRLADNGEINECIYCSPVMDGACGWCRNIDGKCKYCNGSGSIKGKAKKYAM